MRSRTHAGEEMWRCDACGAFTLEPLQVCSECQAKRLETPTTAKRKKTKVRSKARKTGSGGSMGSRTRLKERRKETPEGDQFSETLPEEESVLFSPKVAGPEPSSSELPEPIEVGESQEVPLREAASTKLEDETPAGVAEQHEPREPTEAVEHVESMQVQEEESQTEFQDRSARIPFLAEPNIATELGDRLGLVFVNTPVSELIKRRIDIDFEAFPTVSVGRSPENVIVIPDAGVSRTHAELKREGGQVLLADLNSSNGTYVYDGKEFRRVEGTVSLMPNAVIKLGTGTILRFVSDDSGS